MQSKLPLNVFGTNELIALLPINDGRVSFLFKANKKVTEPQGSSYMVLEGVGLLPRSVASITSLKAALVMCRASNNCEVPMLSKVSDCILEMCTPRSRCMPEHSMQMIMPKLVDSQVASVAKNHH